MKFNKGKIFASIFFVLMFSIAAAQDNESGNEPPPPVPPPPPPGLPIDGAIPIALAAAIFYGARKSIQRVS